MNTLCAAYEANRCCPESPLLKALTGCRHDLRVIGQPEIVVGAHVDHVCSAFQADVIFLL